MNVSCKEMELDLVYDWRPTGGGMPLPTFVSANSGTLYLLGGYLP